MITPIAGAILLTASLNAQDADRVWDCPPETDRIRGQSVELIIKTVKNNLRKRIETQLILHNASWSVASEIGSATPGAFQILRLQVPADFPLGHASVEGKVNGATVGGCAVNIVASATPQPRENCGFFTCALTAVRIDFRYPGGNERRELPFVIRRPSGASEAGTAAHETSNEMGRVNLFVEPGAYEILVGSGAHQIKRTIDVKARPDGGVEHFLMRF